MVSLPLTVDMEAPGTSRPLDYGGIVRVYRQGPLIRVSVDGAWMSADDAVGLAFDLLTEARLAGSVHPFLADALPKREPIELLREADGGMP